MTRARPRRAWPGLATLLLGGCGAISGLGGGTDYGCKAPVGVHCASVSGVYANALQDALPSQRTATSADAPRGQAASAPAAAPDRADGAPLRAPARVLRLWIKAAQDGEHDLVDSHVVYVALDEAHWQIDTAPPASAAAPAVPRPARAPGATSATSATGAASAPLAAHALPAIEAPTVAPPARPWRAPIVPALPSVPPLPAASPVSAGTSTVPWPELRPDGRPELRPELRPDGRVPTDPTQQ